MKLYKNRNNISVRNNLQNVISSVNSENHNLFRKDGMVAFNYRLFINEFEDSKLDEIFDMLFDGEAYDTLEVRISSPGGYVLDLQRFQNVIENYFQNRTYTVLDNYGYSAGAFMFLLGNERIAHKSSMIMFHDWSGGYWGKASDIDKQHKFQREHYKNWMRDLLSNFFTEKEIEDMFEGKEYWYNTVEMCKKGIATHVMIDGDKYTAKEYLAYEKEKSKLKREKPKKESKTKENKNNKVIKELDDTLEELETLENIEKIESKEKNRTRRVKEDYKEQKDK